MAKQYLIDEVPEEYRGNVFDTGMPVGVYLDSNTNQMVIQVTEGGMPVTWGLGTMEVAEAPKPLKKSDIPAPKKVVIGDRSMDTRPAQGYPIDHIVKIIEAART
jgi:hypothetical protein